MWYDDLWPDILMWESLVMYVQGIDVCRNCGRIHLWCNVSTFVSVEIELTTHTHTLPQNSEKENNSLMLWHRLLQSVYNHIWLFGIRISSFTNLQFSLQVAHPLHVYTTHSSTTSWLKLSSLVSPKLRPRYFESNKEMADDRIYEMLNPADQWNGNPVNGSKLVRARPPAPQRSVSVGDSYYSTPRWV